MPYVHVKVTQELTTKKIDRIAHLFGEAITIIPEKTYERTMIHINDNQIIFRGGEQADCAYFETRVYKKIPADIKLDYIKRIFEIFKEELNLNGNQIYLNILEISNWGSKDILLLEELE